MDQQWVSLTRHVTRPLDDPKTTPSHQKPAPATQVSVEVLRTGGNMKGLEAVKSQLKLVLLASYTLFSLQFPLIHSPGQEVRRTSH